MQTTLKDQLVGQFGDAVAASMLEIEESARVKRAGHYKELRSELSQVQAAIDAERRAATKRQAPLEAEMNRRYADYLRSCEALEQAHRADQAALAGLVERTHQLIREITKDPFADRVKNWTKLSEAEMPQLQAS